MSKKNILVKESSNPSLVGGEVGVLAEPQKEVKLNPITINFGREDLNQLINKINEIIAYLNQ